MTTISSKIFEIFRNLKSDAVPRAPRPTKSKKNSNHETPEENNENVDSSNEPEEILIESDDDTQKDDKKPKFKKSFFKTNKKNDGFPKSDKYNKQDGGSVVNTQATGNVINIVNSKNVRMGNDYYMGPANMANSKQQQQTTTTNNVNGRFKEDSSEEHIEKCNNIKLLMEAKIKPTHEYIDYISKNLGKNWHSFFRSLGYTKGAIETVEIDTSSYGVSEARYKLLLDWVNNDDDGTLGHLAKLLWEEGERQIVKELSILYKKSKK